MLDPQQAVADIVLDHSECASVLQRHHIGFCCNGKLTLADACKQQGANLDTVKADLEQAISARNASAAAGQDARSLSTQALVEHITTKHHALLRNAFPMVDALARKVSRVHGNGQPHLRELETAVLTLLFELDHDVEHEEAVLFPLLLDAKAPREKLSLELDDITEGHRRIAALLTRVRDLTSDFTPPPGACNSYRALYAELGAVVDDTLRHVTTENHALFARFSPQ